MLNTVWMTFSTSRRLPGWQPLVSHEHCEVPRTSGPERGHRLHLFVQTRAPIGSKVQVVNGQRAVAATIVESNIVTDSVGVLPDRRVRAPLRGKLAARGAGWIWAEQRRLIQPDRVR